MSTTASTPRRILLIDDDSGGVTALGELLASFGHEVRVATDSTEGERLLDEFSPQVVLLDLNLPDIDGWSLARRVRNNPDFSPRPLLVALSAYNEEQHRQRSREAGFDFHLGKPAPVDVLFEVLGHEPESEGVAAAGLPR